MTIDEAVLHRLVGRTSVMAAQMEKVIEYSYYPNIFIRSLPYGIGEHPAAGDNFRIMSIPEQAPGVVHVDGLVGSIHLEQPSDLERYHKIFQALHAVASGQSETLKMPAKERQI